MFYKLSQENLMFYLYNDINKYEKNLIFSFVKLLIFLTGKTPFISM